MLANVKSRTTKRHTHIPIGRVARLAFQIEAMRSGCCLAAQRLMRHEPLDEAELEDCARLDESLARAHRMLKAAVRDIMLARIHRGSRKSRSR